METEIVYIRPPAHLIEHRDYPPLPPMPERVDTGELLEWLNAVDIIWIEAWDKMNADMEAIRSMVKE